MSMMGNEICELEARVAVLEKALREVCRVYNDGMDTDYRIASQMRLIASSALYSASLAKPTASGERGEAT